MACKNVEGDPVKGGEKFSTYWARCYKCNEEEGFSTKLVGVLEEVVMKTGV